MSQQQTTRERELQWKFRWESTTELESRLMFMGSDQKDLQRDIEFELVRRGATYIKRSYYDGGSTIVAADGSSMTFSAARAARFDWDRMIDAENAYIDEIMAKPIPHFTHAEMSALVSNSAMSMIRRVVPDLIAADICGVQPMSASHNWFNVRTELANKPDVEKKSFCLPKDVRDDSLSWIRQWVKNHEEMNKGLSYYARNGQSVGRVLRNTMDSEVKIIDYMNLLHAQADAFKSVKLPKSDYYLADRDVEFMYQTPIKLFEPQRMVYADIGNDDIRHYYPSEAPVAVSDEAHSIKLDTKASDNWAALRDAMMKTDFPSVKAIAVAPAHPPTELFMGSCSSGIYPPAYKAIRKKEVDFADSVTRPEAEPQKSTLAFNADDEIQAIMEGITFNLRRKEDDEFAQTVSVTMDKLRVNSLGGISFEHYNSWAKQEADEPLSFVLPTPEKDEL